MWFTYLDELGIDPLKVHRTHLDMWRQLEEGRGLKPASITRRMSTIVTFYQWLVDDDLLIKNPVSGARRPKVHNASTREWLTRLEMYRFIEAAAEEGGYPYLLACLLTYNGLRIAEATSLDVEDHWTESYIHYARIMGKGQKPDDITLPAETMVAFDLAVAGRTSGPLLLNKTGTRMQRDAAGRIVKRLAHKVGVTKHITPHSLRHSIISALLDAGHSPRDVQHFARHEDSKTTARYDRTGKRPERSLAFHANMTVRGAG